MRAARPDDAVRAAQAVLAGEHRFAALPPRGGLLRGDVREGGALLSGSFNPLHRGHRLLAEVAGRILAREVAFELPLVNADKAPIDVPEAARRATQFSGFATVFLTRAPLFSLKAELFPRSVFVIGADTLARVLQPRFYGGVAAMDAALTHLRARGCRFLAAGRRDEDVFVTLADVRVPARHVDLFDSIPEEDFRVDLSSTEIRAGHRTP